MATKSNGSSKEMSIVANLIKGATGSLAATSSLTVLGTAMLVSAILTKLQGYAALGSNVAQTYAAWRKAVADQKAAMPELRQFTSAFIAVLKQQLGPGNPVLQNFGIAPPKTRKQLSAEEKATSAALAKRTKKVRGPTGKVQRAQVTVEGKPGLQFVDPSGTPQPGLTRGPVPPAQLPADAPPVAEPAAPAKNGSGPGNGA